MLKIDTSGDYAEIEIGGSAEELYSELVMVVASVCSGIAKQNFMAGMLLLARVTAMLNNEEFITDVMLGHAFDNATSTTTQREGESLEDARKRAAFEAMQKFTQQRPIKVDENYNMIDEEEEEDND